MLAFLFINYYVAKLVKSDKYTFWGNLQPKPKKKIAYFGKDKIALQLLTSVVDFISIFCTYHILLNKVRTFYMENNAEIFPAHYTWKVAEKGFKMASTMNKLATINSCDIVLEK